MPEMKERLAGMFANEADFPMITKTLRAGAKPPKNDALIQARMEVIYLGCETDDATVEVVCWLEAPENGIANIFEAAIVDRAGATVSRERFVSFDSNNAMAALEVPRAIYRECSARLTAVSLSAGAAILEIPEIPLESFGAPTRREMSPEFHVTHPAKKPCIPGEEIKIRYGAGGSETFDYDYRQARGEDQIYLPSEGFVVVPGNKFDSVQNVSLWMSTGKETPVYNGAPSEVTYAGSTLSWKFDEKWGQPMRANFPSGSWADNVGYFLTFDCKMNGDPHNVEKFLITNKPWKTKESYELFVIPHIRIYLDCVAEGSMVSMADGSRKPVEQLCAGDSVQAADGIPAAVNSVDGDQAAEAVGKLKLTDGRELFVTQGHIVFLKDGGVPAGRVKPGDDRYGICGGARGDAGLRPGVQDVLRGIGPSRGPILCKRLCGGRRPPGTADGFPGLGAGIPPAGVAHRL